MLGNGAFQCLQTMIDGIAFQQIVFQDLIGPLAEAGCIYTINSITNRKNHVEIIDFYCSLHFSISFLSNYFHFGNSCFTFQFFTLVDISNMLGNRWNFCSKLCCNLRLCQPNTFLFQSYFQSDGFIG